jgi:putative transposase
MEKSYQFRLYPTSAQEKNIQSTFDSCRFVYNHYLAKRTATYQQTGKNLDYYACSADLTKLKQQLPWLRAADCTALQSSLRNLDTAFQKLFQKSGYPNFKSKREPRKSYTSKRIAAKDNIAVGRGFVKLPKLGEVKCRVSRWLEGRIISATVSQHASGKYFVSVCCTEVETRPLTKTEAHITLEDFTFSPDMKRIAKLKQTLSRKTKDGKNYEKARIKLARAQEHIANQRKDALHKLTARIIRENDVIYVNQATDGELLRQLEYKCRWHGKELIREDKRLTA